MLAQAITISVVAVAVGVLTALLMCYCCMRLGTMTASRHSSADVPTALDSFAEPVSPMTNGRTWELELNDAAMAAAEHDRAGAPGSPVWHEGAAPTAGAKRNPSSPRAMSEEDLD